MITLAWMLSLIIWVPWIYAWPYIEGKNSIFRIWKSLKKYVLYTVAADTDVLFIFYVLFPLLRTLLQLSLLRRTALPHLNYSTKIFLATPHPHLRRNI
jgi:hypothetical protein